MSGGNERIARRMLKKAAKREALVETAETLAEVCGADPTSLTILDVMDHPRLLGSVFRGVTWHAWRAFLAVLFGLALTEAMQAVYYACTGRETVPAAAAREAWVIVGRRGGKSRIAALIAVFLACFRSYAGCLAPGERGTVMVLAADRKQARTILRYVRGLLDRVPALAAMVEARRADSLDLVNGITIEVHTASYKTVRGYSIVAALCEEIAFWENAEDAANPDAEILAALRPAMATIPGALLLAISSPYARRGELWRAYETHYSKDSPVLVWQADTRSMNPAVDPAVITTAYEEDESRAEAEYGAQFRRDVENVVTREIIAAAVVPNRVNLPPSRGFQYRAFVDPSGGSQDSFTLAIAHREQDRAVLDVAREVRPPFSPDQVVQDFADVLRSYGLREVRGDYYGGLWPTERFQRHGITYRRSESSKSDLYKAVLPLLTGGRAELLDLSRLRAQFLGLERRTARGGRDSIDHRPGGHDDLANAVAGALLEAVPVKPTASVGFFHLEP
jgi:hypothetical protein